MNAFLVRERAREVVARTAERLTSPEEHGSGSTSLDQGNPGIALLFAELGRADTAFRPIAHSWLTAAGGRLRVRGDDGLYRGAAALAFALHAAAAGPGDYSQALDRLEGVVISRARALLRTERARKGSGGLGARMRAYDLISGATGLGAYFLSRNRTAPELRALLSYLVELTEPTRDHRGRPAQGWWAAGSPAPQLSSAYPLGHYNLGIAHGISGPLALLSSAWIEGVRVPGHSNAITRIATWLMPWGPTSPRTDPWRGWPGILLPGKAGGSPVPPGRPQRPTWCYGTAGTARALQLAGLALSRPEWARAAVESLVAVLDEPASTRLITDLTLCHGWAGLLHCAGRVAHASGDPRLHARLPVIAESVLDRFCFEHPPGFLTGLAGIALALHAFASASAPLSSWDRCLLLG